MGTPNAFYLLSCKGSRLETSLEILKIRKENHALPSLCNQGLKWFFLVITHNALQVSMSVSLSIGAREGVSGATVDVPAPGVGLEINRKR